MPGNPSELWEARDVPHGVVQANWQKSKVTGDTRAYYVYTPPGMYRRGYHANTPDYNQAYQYPPSLYGDPRSDAGESQRRRNLYSPYYNRSGNPRNPSDVWNSPYDSPPR